MPWSTRLFSTEKEPGSLLPAKSTNLYLPLSAWEVGFSLGNTELSMNLCTVIASMSGFDDD